MCHVTYSFGAIFEGTLNCRAYAGWRVFESRWWFPFSGLSSFPSYTPPRHRSQDRDRSKGEGDVCVRRSIVAFHDDTSTELMVLEQWWMIIWSPYFSLSVSALGGPSRSNSDYCKIGWRDPEEKVTIPFISCLLTTIRQCRSPFYNYFTFSSLCILQMCEITTADDGWSGSSPSSYLQAKSPPLYYYKMSRNHFSVRENKRTKTQNHLVEGRPGSTFHSFLTSL